MICLKKASTNNYADRKGKASSLGASKLLLVVGDLHVVVDSTVWMQQPGRGKDNKKKSKGGYSK